jgi:hypothetical protein
MLVSVALRSAFLLGVLAGTRGHWVVSPPRLNQIRPIQTGIIDRCRPRDGGGRRTFVNAKSSGAI